MCQFSCHVWHSTRCLAGSHLCLPSLELPKHPLSFCSLTSVWGPWHHSAWAFCIILPAARCSRARWLSSSSPTTQTSVDKGCSPKQLCCASLTFLVSWKLQPAGCIPFFFVSVDALFLISFSDLHRTLVFHFLGTVNLKG